MTSVQKVIKYLAIAFAIFLSVAIICSIVTGGYLVLKGTKIINSDKVEDSKLLEELVTISDDNGTITSLELEIKTTNLKIINGENFVVKTNNPDVKFSNNDGKVVIEDKSKNIWTNLNDESNIIIYMPTNINKLSKVKIRSGVGKVCINSINTQVLDLEAGLGETTIDNLVVTEKAKIESGMGRLNINSCSIKNANIDLGVGEVNITGDILGNSEINTGVGKLGLNLTSAKENYTLKVEKGLGKISFNKNNISNDTTLGDGQNYINIEGGIGSIDIKTNNI